jgi:AraC-like DNA-binding protein
MSGRIRKQLEKSLQYIDAHLGEKITVYEVADVACISIFHFQRLFSAYLGETVSQYILHRRLELAAQTIVNQKKLKLADLARKSGFETHSAFSRAFKKHFTISPREFRESPSSAKLSSDSARPYLNTIAPKNKSLDVDVVDLTTHWFNYKSVEIVADGTGFHESVLLIASDMKIFLDVGKPHLFGTATSRSYGQACRVENLEDLMYGAVYSKKGDDDWSDSWLELEAGLWAVCTHKGNYEYSYHTWNNLLRSWLSESNYELRDTISFERYLNRPWLLQNSDDWRTQIYLPIQKA